VNKYICYNAMREKTKCALQKLMDEGKV